MTRFEQWIIRRIIRKQVQQGTGHAQNITELYREIRTAVEREFYEDNLVTQNSYLREWFENSLRKPTS